MFFARTSQPMSQFPRWMQVPCCWPCALVNVLECFGLNGSLELVVPVWRERDGQRSLREAISMAQLFRRFAGELEALRQLAVGHASAGSSSRATLS